jgi:hypothetical protein
MAVLNAPAMKAPAVAEEKEKELTHQKSAGVLDKFY